MRFLALILYILIAIALLFQELELAESRSERQAHREFTESMLRTVWGHTDPAYTCKGVKK